MDEALPSRKSIKMDSSAIMTSTKPYLYITTTCMILIAMYSIKLATAYAITHSKVEIHWLRQKTLEQESDVKEQEHVATITEHNCPKSWWSDPKGFELERRAIFCKEWLFACHTSNFKKAGDYRTLEIAGFSYIVILGKDNQLRAFHNVCRHRAYAVTKKEVGSSTILGCRYHGWSYDAMGKLIKAPEFDGVQGFKKESNSLWEIRSEVRDGMVLVNFDNRSDIVKPLGLNGADIVLNRWGLNRMMPLADWKLDGAFNWKLMCTRRCLVTMQQLSFYRRIEKWVWEEKEENLWISGSTRIRRYRHGIVLFVKLVPKSSSRTILECSLFAKNLNMPVLQTESIREEVAAEVADLVTLQQRLLRDGSRLSELHMIQQKEISQILRDHADAEYRVGMEIQPAAQAQSFSLEGKADHDFCKDLESVCTEQATGLLDW